MATNLKIILLDYQNNYARSLNTMNNTARNKIEKSNNFGNSLQNPNSKPKVSNENYCSPYNGNYY